MQYSPHQLAYFAHKLTLRAATDSMDRMASALLDAQVDLNPHQIPKMVLQKCEWGHDDYSLNVENLPSLATTAPKASRPSARQGSLFDAEG